MNEVLRKLPKINEDIPANQLIIRDSILQQTLFMWSLNKLYYDCISIHSISCFGFNFEEPAFIHTRKHVQYIMTKVHLNYINYISLLYIGDLHQQYTKREVNIGT